LVPASGGVFEVKSDGKLLFSKKAEGRFPEHHEVLDQL
jgi:selenoprotein W-related protein